MFRSFVQFIAFEWLASKKKERKRRKKIGKHNDTYVEKDGIEKRRGQANICRERRQDKVNSSSLH